MILYLCVFLFQIELAKFELGNNRFITVSEYKSEIYVHIRQYEEDIVSKKLYPTQKGCALTPSRFANLLLSVTDIDENVTKLRKPDGQEFKYTTHLGGGIFCTMTSGYQCVNFRSYYTVEDRLMPTKKGISLRLSEWDAVKSKLDKIRQLAPQLSDARPCDYDIEHNEADCADCNAFKRSIRMN